MLILSVLGQCVGLSILSEVLGNIFLFMAQALAQHNIFVALVFQLSKDPFKIELFPIDFAPFHNLLTSTAHLLMVTFPISNLTFL